MLHIQKQNTIFGTLGPLVSVVGFRKKTNKKYKLCGGSSNVHSCQIWFQV